jgi:hypothetical protein
MTSAIGVPTIASTSQVISFKKLAPNFLQTLYVASRQIGWSASCIGCKLR